MPIAAIILSACAVVGAQQVSGHVPRRERDVLMEFFAATGGDRWKRRDGWGSSQPVCEWYGVWCDFIEGDPNRPVVAGLSLPLNDLRGVLPRSLTELEHLQILSLAGNHLSGDVPEALLERWDRHQLNFTPGGNSFRNLVARATVEYSSSGTLCAVHDDTHFRLELDEVNDRATFESRRCADIRSRRTYCLVREGTPGSLGRLSRALASLGYRKFGENYNYPAGWTTHDVFLTTTATWGDASTKTVETYGRQGPREVWMAQQLFLGLMYEVSWTREFRRPKCGFEQ